MTEADRIERIRHQVPFETELENVDEELGWLPIVVSQKVRARKPRGRVTAEGKTIGNLIEGLSNADEYAAESAKELWPHFFAVLDRWGLGPKECEDSMDPRKHAYFYDFHDGRKQITFGQFANVVSRARRKKKSA